MRVSHNELLRSCHKAFEALGFPDGVDRDVAFAVMWLESHGPAGTRLLGTVSCPGWRRARRGACGGWTAPAWASSSWMQGANVLSLRPRARWSWRVPAHTTRSCRRWWRYPNACWWLPPRSLGSEVPVAAATMTDADSEGAGSWARPASRQRSLALCEFPDHRDRPPGPATTWIGVPRK
ncbi:MAG: DUF3726 domain-containing protein [Gammaproteobacteria bacterium]|nr:DUF3726 domain-containing protein [Gammaproteobacteria bacterium]NIR82940.1 DUF3726 domain-containing protein [Gammaproteobacteria bacterium]NIR90209.1 DUF3726 domain-containing protein [Gammaproteobacteria bacterium]NIU04086.1 DUF3726 domain-containing protein [Gammaproteobacteria bacterium]NIV51075.1 DUF3726 domain-containing protein [Gammaproteobacteria bacterium]